MIQGVGTSVGSMHGPVGPDKAGAGLEAEKAQTARESNAEHLERLRQASEDMEGVFIGYLTRALRATVPNGGSPDAPGADMYGSLLDDHLAQSVANDTRTGIAEALYRQLASRFITSQGEGEV